ncbi:MAG: hypothetical protein K6U00_00985 [Armatimonadetes bacterium]|nr:hypothetical protein [Armatimonadota bacterium]
MVRVLIVIRNQLLTVLLAGLTALLAGCDGDRGQDPRQRRSMEPTLVWSVPGYDVVALAFDDATGTLLVSHVARHVVDLDVREAKSGEVRYRIGEGLVLAVDSTSNTAVVASSENTKITTYDLRRREAVRTEEVPDGMICTAASPNGKKLALWEKEKRIIRILEDGRLSKPLGKMRTDDYPNFACFSPDGTLLASVEKLSGFLGKARYRAVVYDTASGKPKCVIRDAIWPFAFSPDSRALASRYRDGKVMVWDMKSGKVKTRLQDWRDIGAVRHIAFSPDGSLIATGGNGWHRRKPNWLKQLFDPRTATVSLGGDVALSEAKTGETLWSTTVSKYQTVTAMAFSPDGAYLAVATGRPKASLMMWRLK